MAAVKINPTLRAQDCKNTAVLREKTEKARRLNAQGYKYMPENIKAPI